MLGVPKGNGNWFQQQWGTITGARPIPAWPPSRSPLGTVVIIVGFKRFLPKVPGCDRRGRLSIVLSTVTDAAAHGVAVIGSVKGGFPPIGLPQGITWSDVPKCSAIAVLLLRPDHRAERGDLAELRDASMASGSTSTGTSSG